MAVGATRPFQIGPGDPGNSTPVYTSSGWALVALASMVSGVLPLANGGTGADLSSGLGFLVKDTTGHVVVSRALLAADLPSTAVTPGSYGSASQVMTGTVDAQGRLTSAASVAISINGSAISAGTVVAARLPSFGAAAAGIVPLSGGGTSNFLRADGSWVAPPGATSGTVTSVDLTIPAEAVVTGNPITNSGTLAVSWVSQAANLVFAGPSSGSVAVPAFRALVAADLPITAVTPGTYGSATAVSQVTVDAQGRLTGANNQSIAGLAAGVITTGTFASARIPDLAVGGDVSGTVSAVTLGSVITAGGPTGSATAIPVITYDAKGRLLTVTTATPTVSSVNGNTYPASAVLGSTLYGSGAGTMAFLAPNTTSTNKFFTMTGTGTIGAVPAWSTLVAGDLPATTVTAASYGSASQVATFTVDAAGRLTAAASTSIAINASAVTAGQLALARGGSNADLSATGGANQIVRQNSSGGAFTVSVLAAADIPSLNASKINAGQLALTQGGTGVDLSAGGGTTFVLAQDGSHVISARALVAADIPSLAGSKITTGSVAATVGGTGLTSYTTGDTLYASATNTLLQLAGNTTATKKYYSMTSSVPSYAVIAMADLGTGTPSAANYLRGDGSWQAVTPAAAGSDKQIQFNDATALAGAVGLAWDKTNTRLGVGVASPAYCLDVAASFASPTGFQRACQILITGTAADTSSQRQALVVAATNTHTSGTVESVRGTRINMTASGSGGTTTAAYGYDYNLTVGSGATVGTSYGIKVANASVTGTLTTQVGMQIDALTTGGSNIALACLGGRSFHVGNFAFGANASASYPVDVTGDINLTGTIRVSGLPMYGGWSSTSVNYSIPATETTTLFTVAATLNGTLPLANTVAAGHTKLLLADTATIVTILASGSDTLRGTTTITPGGVVVGRRATSNGSAIWYLS